MFLSQVRTNAEKYDFTAEKAYFAKSSRQGLANLRSDLPRLKFHADHDAVVVPHLSTRLIIYFRSNHSLILGSSLE